MDLIVHATDGSAEAAQALDLAIELAKDTGAKLAVLSVAHAGSRRQGTGAADLRGRAAARLAAPRRGRRGNGERRRNRHQALRRDRRAGQGDRAPRQRARAPT